MITMVTRFVPIVTEDRKCPQAYLQYEEDCCVKNGIAIYVGMVKRHSDYVPSQFSTATPDDGATLNMIKQGICGTVEVDVKTL